MEGTYLLNEEVNPEDKTKTITLIYGGNTLTERQKEAIGEKAKDFSLEDIRLVFKQGFSIDDVNGRETQRESQLDALKAEVNRLQMALREKDRQEEVRKTHAMLGGRLLSEIQALYPQIVACTYGRVAAFRKGIEGPDESDVVVFKTKARMLKMTDRRKIQSWLTKRTSRENIQVFYEN
ncbi:MAG: hypothetical protein ABFD59_04805 [Smithella sp.]